MMAPEMMRSEVTFGPSAYIYSFGVVMWEVWSGRKPWSELSDKLEIFKAVRDDKRRLRVTNDVDNIEGYEKLMRSCTEYKASRRPLIDSVRSDLQALLERAAEVDIKKTAHSELTHQGSMAREDKLLNVMKSDDDSKTSSQNDDSRSSAGSQGTSGRPAVHIEMSDITAIEQESI